MLKTQMVIFLVCFPVSYCYSQTTYTSAQSGTWSNSTTWSPAGPPTSTDHVVVANGHTVTLTAAVTISNLTINSGGVLDDDNKGDMTVNGNLAINGTVTGQRNIQFTGGAGTSIAGTGVHNSTKDIVVNGTTSFLSTTYLTVINNVDLGSGVTLTNNGTVIINNDLKGVASSVWVNAANSTVKVGKNLFVGAGTLTASASGNTVVFNRGGAQSITTPSGATFYNLTIEGTGTKTVGADLTISGNLTITSGTLDTDAANNYDLTISGNFTNSGTFNENLSIVTFTGTASQTITNSSGETFYQFTLNKSAGTLTLANNVIVSNTLTMTAGVINAGANTLTLGTSTANQGTLSYTAGQIVGLFQRWIANTSTGVNINFPVGVSSNPRMATINFTGINTGGTVLFEFVASNPGSAGLSLVDGAVTIYNTFVEGYWSMSKANSFNLGPNTFSMDLSGTGFTAFTIDAVTRLLSRTATNWLASGTHVAAVNPTAKRSGLSAMPSHYAFGDDTNCTAPTTSAITGDNDVCTSEAAVAYSVTNTVGSTYAWTITGGTQATGGTTNSITVNWGATGQVGNVSVVETNACTSGPAVNFSTDINSIPPTSMTGSTNVAESTQNSPYSVTSRTGYTYTWTITGGTLVTGQGTSSITINWLTAGVGNVSVVAQKTGCAAASAFSIDVIKYIVINSAQTGNWASASTWVTNSVPLPTENARILNTHNVTITASEAITNFIIDAGGQLTSTNKRLTVSGNITVNGTYSGGTSQLELDGANTSIDGTGTINITGADVDIMVGNKTIASTAVLNVTAGIVDVLAGITVTNNGSINIVSNLAGGNATTTIWTNSDNSTLKVGGVLLATGVLNATATGNTVEYNGAGAQTIKTPSSSTYYNLTLSGGGTKTAPSANVNITKNFTNGVTFAANSQTITLNGTTAQTIAGVSTTTFFNLIVNNTLAGNAITLSRPIIVSNAFTLTDGIVLTTATNKVSMGSAATVSGFSDGSFVNGPMTYTSITSNTVTFPVGKDSELHRVNLTVNGTSSNYTTEYIHSSATALGFTLPGTLDKVSGIGYWTITRDAGGAVTSASVNLYYNGNDVVNDAPNLRVAKVSGASPWVDIGGTGTASPTGNILSTTNFTTFSDFSLANNTGGTNPLPIELVEFTAELIAGKVQLKWVTASELNNDFFVVERTLNGESFTTITTVPGGGTTNQRSVYTAFDFSPAFGKNYYRIKQVDFDGQFSYSELVFVMVTDLESWKVYPNPYHTGKLTLQLNSLDIEKSVLICLYDLQGRIVYKKEIAFLANDAIDITPVDLASGVYLVSVAVGNNRKHIKVIVR